jgi:hypothetical protein
MNLDLQKELLVIIQNYQPEICDDCQVRILAKCSKFVNNPVYMDKVKNILDPFFSNDRDFNFWVELPKIISSVIELNKTVVAGSEIEVDYMKFVLYAIIYHYFDTFQKEILNKQNEGDIRIIFMNILSILLTKPKKIRIKKQSLFSIIFNCIFGDSGILRL